MSERRRPIVLYNPRGESQILPLGLTHVGSLFRGRRVEIVDGRVELAPEARVSEWAGEAVCLGVSVRTGAPILDALAVTRAARATRPDLPVIWGGWHPSLMPEQCLESGLVDACVVGQGERSFAEVVDALDARASLEGVAGLVWRRGGEVVRNAPRPFEDVNRFPSVDFALLDLERYFVQRGVRRLDYCSSQGGQQRWSGLRAERVVAELIEHAARYRLSEARFNDDNFFTDLKRVESICRGLLESRTVLRWSATGRADMLRRLSDDQLHLLRESGCSKINVGPESGSAQREIGKGTRLERVLATAKKLHRHGIGARFSFVAGTPNEPPESLAEIYTAVKSIRAIDGEFETPIDFYAPYPGTELAERMPAVGFAPPERLEDWEGVDLDHSIGPWIPGPVRTWVPRYNFYLRHGYQQPGRGWGPKLLHHMARARVRTGFYRLDVERRAVDLWRRLRTGFDRQQPTIAED